MPDSSRTPKQFKAALVSNVTPKDSHAPTSTSTTESSTPRKPAAIAVDIEPHHPVTVCESATVPPPGSADAVQQLLAALQANLKRLEWIPFAPVAASGPAKKASLVRASKLECKNICEV